jgi:DNA (cytosine-5)-methyltransferase 1
MSDQSRASAWHILRWAEALYIENILIENVREFRDWGPLGAHGRPLKAKKGELYRQFIRSLRALGYHVEDRLLTAADYGDATTRERLFIQARRGSRKVRWPDASHRRPDEDTLGLFPDRPRWTAAREIIDWTLTGTSIYGRKRPLAENTLARIFAGLRKFSGLPVLSGSDPARLEPFLVILRNNSSARSVDRPCPTVTAGGGHLGLAEPWLVEYHGEQNGSAPRVRSVNRPLNTIDTSNRLGLARPFLVSYYGTGSAQSVDAPLDTITTRDRFGLVTPELVGAPEFDGEVVGQLDILFRMLQPAELAAAMSFPADYQFEGSRESKVRQIGNAVPVRLATALCRSVMGWGVAG